MSVGNPLGRGKVLVTGSTGFVGRALTEALKDAGVSWRGTASKASANVLPVTPLNGTTNWRPALEGCDSVVHLAARAHRMERNSSDLNPIYEQINSDATEQLARQAAELGVKRLVFVSTIKVLGERTTVEPFHASDMPDPQDAYARSKWSAEQKLWQVRRETGLEVVVVRTPLVYGPEVKGNLALLALAIRYHIPLPLSAIKNRRTMISVRNLSDVVMCCLNHPNASGKTLLVGDGCPMSTPELVRIMAQGLNKRCFVWPLPEPVLYGMAHLLGKKGAVARLCESLEVDISDTQKILGWVPPFEPRDELLKAMQTFTRAASKNNCGQL